MPTGHPVYGCKRCGAPGRRKHELTRSGYCTECAAYLAGAGQLQISEHNGPVFEKWRRSMALSVGALLPQDLAALLEERM